jgi:hypothetical protein
MSKLKSDSETFSSANSETRMNLTEILQFIVYYLTVLVCPSIFIGLFVFTLGMKERDTKLKLREIMQSVFKKMF